MAQDAKNAAAVIVIDYEPTSSDASLYDVRSVLMADGMLV